MPGPADDRFFGGTKGAAEKAYRNMKRTYGKDAEHVYKATIAKRKRKGQGKRSLAQRLLG